MSASLTRVQFLLLMFVVQTGTVFILFQRPFIEIAKRDAWVIFIAASFIHYLLLILYERNYQFFKLTKITTLLYVGYWLFVSFTSIAFIDYTLAEWAFPKTPQFIVILLMVIVSLYGNLCRDEVIVNLGAILIPIMLLFILFLIMALDYAEWSYLFPIGEASITEWGKSMLKIQFPFIGIELYLVYRGYVVKHQTMKGLPIFIYQLIWLSFFLFTIMITIAFFPMKEIESISEPIMYILKSQQVSFVERLDLFFIYIWMVWGIITITIFSFTAIFTFRKQYSITSKKPIYIYHFLLCMLPLLGLSKQSVEQLQNILLYTHIVFVYVLPFIIILQNRRQVG